MYYGTFTLHGNGNETGTWKGNGTKGNNGSGHIPGSGAVWTVLHNVLTVPSPVPGPTPGLGFVQCERAIRL